MTEGCGVEEWEKHGFKSNKLVCALDHINTGVMTMVGRYWTNMRVRIQYENGTRSLVKVNPRS